MKISLPHLTCLLVAAATLVASISAVNAQTGAGTATPGGVNTQFPDTDQIPNFQKQPEEIRKTQEFQHQFPDLGQNGNQGADFEIENVQPQLNFSQDASEFLNRAREPRGTDIEGQQEFQRAIEAFNQASPDETIFSTSTSNQIVIPGKLEPMAEQWLKAYEGAEFRPIQADIDAGKLKLRLQGNSNNQIDQDYIQRLEQQWLNGNVLNDPFGRLGLQLRGEGTKAYVLPSFDPNAEETVERGTAGEFRQTYDDIPIWGSEQVILKNNQGTFQTLEKPSKPVVITICVSVIPPCNWIDEDEAKTRVIKAQLDEVRQLDPTITKNVILLQQIEREITEKILLEKVYMPLKATELSFDGFPNEYREDFLAAFGRDRIQDIAFEAFSLKTDLGEVVLNADNGQVLRNNRNLHRQAAGFSYLEFDENAAPLAVDSNSSEFGRKISELYRETFRQLQEFSLGELENYVGNLTIQYQDASHPAGNTFGKRVTIRGAAYKSPEVIAHELGHIILYELGVRPKTADRDLTEALADVIGLVLSNASLSESEKDTKWRSGLGLGCGFERLLAYPEGNGYNKSKERSEADNCGGPRHLTELALPNDPVCLADQKEKCAHVNATIFGHSAYLLAYGGDKIEIWFDTDNGEKTGRYVSIKGLEKGERALLKQFLRVAFSQKDPQWNRSSFARAFLKECEVWDQSARSKCFEIEKAFAATGILEVSKKLKNFIINEPVIPLPTPQ